MALLSVNFNFAERVGIRSLARAQDTKAEAIERLSTGKQLNRASDDPSGLITSESFKSRQVEVLGLLDSITKDELRYGAFEGALSGVGDLLIDLQGEIVKSANDAGLSEAEKKASQINIDSVVSAIGFLTKTTRYKGEVLLDSTLGASAGTVQASTKDAAGNVVLGKNYQVVAALASLTTSGENTILGGASNAERAQSIVEALSATVNGKREAIGLTLKRLDSNKRQLLVENENLSSAISKIVDTDYAAETSKLFRSQILEQAATISIATARELQAQTVLTLIKGEALGGVDGNGNGSKSSDGARSG